MDEPENGSLCITMKRKRDLLRKDQSSQLADVGEQIGGVIEAVFEAGYLLNVKLSSGTTLRGVVLKPGHYVPFSDENDVAPNAQLVKRNDVPIPSRKQILSCGNSPTSTKRRRGKKRNGNGNGFPNGAPVDHLPVIEASPISSSIGKFVPVVLSPTFSLPNIVSAIRSPFVLEGSSFSNGFAPGHFNQILPYQPQQSLHFRRHGKLLDEVIRRTQSPPDLEEPLSAEPLNSIQPIPTPNGNTKDVKVIELYQERVTNGTKPLTQNGKSSSLQNDDSSSVAEVGSNSHHQDGTPETKHGVDDADFTLTC